ncbi:hypothetical protein N665_0104s0315 [Sinapis alba]|nr:hypothetical protein N665_0104s0315 [Sinapis alba]
MSKQTSMMCHGGSSSQAKRRLDLEEIIKIPDCDMTVMADRFKLTLIGRVLHLGSRSIEALITQLPRPRIWNVEGRVRGRNLGNGRFQFDFDNEKDLQAVLNRRPCHFNQWSFPLERWEPFTRDDFPNTIPFWVQVTGVPVHFWNDGTFTEIAKALGKKLAIDAKSARIQISVNIDMPLQFERKVGFPNGDIGKVNFLYVGLHRHCFTCKRISHDENSCPELTEEQRQQKRLERHASNASGSQRLLLSDENQYRISNGKRPRSPTLEFSRKSPPRKLQADVAQGKTRRHGSGKEQREKDIGHTGNAASKYGLRGISQNYQDNSTQGNTTYSHRRSPPRHTVWNRLDRAPRSSFSPGHVSRSDNHKAYAHSNGRDRTRDIRNRERDEPNQADNRIRNSNESRQQEWRPRKHQSTTTGPRDSGGDRVNVPRDYPHDNQRSQRAEQERSDSQRTISEKLETARTIGDHRNGQLVVHRDESDEDKRRRLKGKDIMNPSGDTPMSKAKDSSSLALLIGRNTIIIREPPALVSPNHKALAIQKEDASRIKPRQEERLGRSMVPLPSHGIQEVGEDGFLNEEQAKMITITPEDEAEVDKLVAEFDDVVMDENMVENDDLLVEEPGFEAEQIEAISQLSPMSIQEDMAGDERDNEQRQANGEALQGSQELKRSKEGSQQNRVDHSPRRQQPARGLLRRKPTSNPESKGTRASRKLQAIRGRSPKKIKGSGMAPKTISHKLPRHEVIPSAVSKKALSFSGSVVSQKPPSKKI